MRFAVALSFTLIPAIAFAQPKPPQVPLPPDAPAIKIVVPAYKAAVAAALKSRKPLVVFVGYAPSRPIQGAVSYQATQEMFDVFDIGISVYLPDGKWFRSEAHLPAHATDAQIQAVWLPKAVSQQAVPFEKSAQAADGKGKPAVGRKKVCDGCSCCKIGCNCDGNQEKFCDCEGCGCFEDPLTSLWGEHEYIRYQPAKYTQEIATTNGLPRISHVSRRLTATKYHQPGGLDGVTGWSSHLYRNGKLAFERKALIPVLNSFGTYQYEIGWHRTYPDAAERLDVLVNTATGRVFEVRRAFRDSGQWLFSVHYRNRSERPAGYAGVQQSCVECHQDAGSGGYGVALAPGGDFIISEPFGAIQ